MDEVLARDEVVDPDQVAALGAYPSYERVHLGSDLRRVRAARTDHELVLGVELQRRCQEMRKTLLPGDASVEERVGAVRVDAVASHRFLGGPAFVDLGVDPVVDDVNAGRIDGRVALEHVIANAARNGDHCVRRLDRGALAKKRECVAAAQLLCLPWPQRLEAVDGHHVRDRPHELGEIPAEVGVPGVAVRNVAAFERGGHGQVDGHRLKGRGFGLGLAQLIPRAVALDSRLFARRSPAVDAHGEQLAKLAHEVLDVGARPAVDLGRVFAREHSDATLQPARLRESAMATLPAP